MTVTFTGGLTFKNGMGLKGTHVVPSSGAVAFTGSNSGSTVTAFDWSSTTGYGTRYSDPGVSSYLSGERHGIDFSPDRAAIAIAAPGTSPYIVAYAWSSSGFGTKYSNPSVAPASTNNSTCRFSPDGAAIFLGGTTIQAYRWNSSTGFGTKYTSPSAISPTIGTILGMAPSPDGTVIAVSGGAGISAYAWNSSTGFGSQYTNASSISSTILQSNSLTFNPAGDVIAVGDFDYPYAHVYKWSNSTGFVSKYTAPSISGMVGNGRGFGFSPDGKYVAIAHQKNVYANNIWPMTVFNWDSTTGFGSEVSITGTHSMPTGVVYGGGAAMFTATGDALIMSTQSGYLYAWAWSSAGCGTKFTSPAILAHASWDATINTT